MSVPDGSKFDGKIMSPLLKQLTIPEDVLTSVIDHNFSKECRITDFQEEVHISQIESDQEDEEASRNIQKEILAATSLQAENMDFMKLQNEDQFCIATKNLIQTPTLGKRFKVKQGVLLRIPGEQVTEKKTISQVPQIVVPQALTDMLIDIYHAGPYGAHLGARRVYLTLRRKYYFTDMQDKINTRIKQCMPCQLNMYTTRPAHKLHVTKSASTPREAWAVDLCPDMPPSKGYYHIMIIMDLATNYVHLRPINAKTSKELLTQTKQTIGMLRPPQVLRHDNEKGLRGGEFKDYCEHMNIILGTMGWHMTTLSPRRW